MPQRRPHPSRRLRRPRRLRLTVSIARLPNTAPTARFRLNRPQPVQAQPTQPIQQQNPQPAQNNGNPFIMRTPFGARQNQNNQQNPNGQPTQRFGMFGASVPPVPPQNGQGGQGDQPNMPGQNGQPAMPGSSKNSNGTTTTVLTAVIAAALSAALCLGVGYAAITSGAVKVPTTSSMANINSSESGSGSATAKSGEAPDWQAVAKQVSGSVVAIQATLSNGVAKGSGAIINTDGDIVTNNHVISGAQKILVTLSNGQMYSAKVVGTEHHHRSCGHQARKPAERPEGREIR